MICHSIRRKIGNNRRLLRFLRFDMAANRNDLWQKIESYNHVESSPINVQEMQGKFRRRRSNGYASCNAASFDLQTLCKRRCQYPSCCLYKGCWKKQGFKEKCIADKHLDP